MHGPGILVVRSWHICVQDMDSLCSDWAGFRDQCTAGLQCNQERLLWVFPVRENCAWQFLSLDTHQKPTQTMTVAFYFWTIRCLPVRQDGTRSEEVAEMATCTPVQSLLRPLHGFQGKEWKDETLQSKTVNFAFIDPTAKESAGDRPIPACVHRQDMSATSKMQLHPLARRRMEEVQKEPLCSATQVHANISRLPYDVA